jgi:hypothetical protein
VEGPFYYYSFEFPTYLRAKGMTVQAGARRVVAWLGRENQEDFSQAVDVVKLLGN